MYGSRQKKMVIRLYSFQNAHTVIQVSRTSSCRSANWFGLRWQHIPPGTLFSTTLLKEYLRGLDIYGKTSMTRTPMAH